MFCSLYGADVRTSRQARRAEEARKAEEAKAEAARKAEEERQAELVRCHAPNRFGTVNMEDNVNIKRS